MEEEEDEEEEEEEEGRTRKWELSIRKYRPLSCALYQRQ